MGLNFSDLNPSNWSVGGHSVGNAISNIGQNLKGLDPTGIHSLSDLGKWGEKLTGTVATGGLLSPGDTMNIGGGIDLGAAALYGGYELGALGGGSAAEIPSSTSLMTDPVLGTIEGAGPQGWAPLTSGGLGPLGAGTAAPAAATTGTMLAKALPYMGVANLLGGLYGLSTGGRQGAQAKQYEQQMADLTAHPENVSKLPGYQAGVDALRRTEASTGYGHSGKEQVDLLNYGSTAYTQQMNLLNQLATSARSQDTTGQTIGQLGTGFGMLAASGMSFDPMSWF